MIKNAWARIGRELLPLKSWESRSTKALALLGLFFIWFAGWWLVTNFRWLPSEVPLAYSQPWGRSQLLDRSFLAFLPLGALLFWLTDLLVAEFLWRRRERLLSWAVLGVGVVASGLVSAALVRTSHLVQPVFIFDLTSKIYLAASLAALVSWLVCPFVIRLAARWGVVDDPETHHHPAILHHRPVPRAGALAFFLAFMVVAALFLPQTKHLLGIYAGVLVAVVLGVLDDRYDLNPYLRLALEILAVGAVVASGIGITVLRNPLGGIIRLDTINIPIFLWGEHHILLLADALALIWMLWVMNILSWSNGVDGQFSGIMAISFLVVVILALRFVGYEPIQEQTALLAAIAGGAALGLLPATWHPAKVFWGFGAIAPGLILAALGILSGAKIATALLVLLVPALDGVVAIVRRTWRGRSPVWGDREHLHHQLLNRGWSQRQVAGFYWGLTGICGVLALLTAEKTKALTILSLGGVVMFFLVLLNLGGSRRARLNKQHETEEDQEERLGD